MDLDNTLLRTDKTISAESAAALEAAAEAGIHVVPASGRPYSSLPEQLRQIRGIRYAITSNGACVYDLTTGQRLMQSLLEPESVDRILDTFPDWTIYEVLIDGVPYAAEEYVHDPLRYGCTPAGEQYVKSTRKPVKDICGFLKEHRDHIDAVDIVSADGDELRRMHEKLAERAPELYLTSSVPGLLEISNTKGGKCHGLEFLSSLLDIKPEEMMTFGDAMNDLDMIRYAGTGVAMENAVPELKEHADCIAPHHNEDGVAHVIRCLMKLGGY